MISTLGGWRKAPLLQRLPNGIDDSAVAIFDHCYDFVTYLRVLRCAGRLVDHLGGRRFQIGNISNRKAGRCQEISKVLASRVDGNPLVGHYHIDGFSWRRGGDYFLRNDREKAPR